MSASDFDSGPAALRHLRQRAQLTQAALAERSGVSVRTIRALERGEVEQPRWASLEALAGAAGLPPGARAGFLHAWSVRAERATYAELWGLSADQPFDARLFLSELGLRTLRMSVHTVVGADRLLDRQQVEITGQAQVDGVAASMWVALDDQGTDVRLTEVRAVSGCTVANVERLVRERDRILVCDLALGDPMEEGEVRTWTYGREFTTRDPGPEGPALRAALTDSDGLTAGCVRRIPMLEVTVRFEGAPPATLWEIKMEPTRVHRLREVRLNSWGAATIALGDVAPGNYGFEWAWAP